MRMGRVLALVLGGAVLCTAAQAQDPEKPKAPAGDPAMEMPKPGPEMEKMKWMVGKWNVTETHEKNDFGPGGPGKGTMVFSLGPGGFSHTFSYSSTGPMGKFSGHGMTAWDAEAKLYRNVWADSMTPGIMTMECREDGKDWVCSGEAVMMGKKCTMRFRSIAPGPAGWTEVMEVSTEGGPYNKMITFEYKKAK